MITYIELWNAKQAWLDLTTEERANYMGALGPAIEQLLAGGAQIISWGENENATFSRSNHSFFAVWTFPDTAAAQGFEKMVEGAGWYNYFEQVNLMGITSSPQEIIGKLINL